jgi:hypothetical protein
MIEKHGDESPIYEAQLQKVAEGKTPDFASYLLESGLIAIRDKKLILTEKGAAVLKESKSE